MSSPDSRGAVPPRPVRVVRVDQEKVLLVRFLAGWQACKMHYRPTGKEKYYPCQNDQCPTDWHRCKPLWRGWAPVELWEEATQLWWPMALEVTESLEEQLRGKQLRGQTWGLSRPKVKKEGNPVVAALVAEGGDFRRPFDVTSLLLRIYRCEKIHWGYANPMPPKLMLEPTEEGLPAGWEELQPEGKKVITPEEQAKARAILKAELERIAGKRNSGENGKKGGEQHG